VNGDKKVLLKYNNGDHNASYNKREEHSQIENNDNHDNDNNYTNESYQQHENEEV
jgi:hypothetical protein